MTNEMSLTVFDPIKAQIAELQAKDDGLVFDHTTPDGEKNLRSYVHRLRSLKPAIADLHRSTKKSALDFGRKVDAVKNELTAGVQKIIDTRMKPLDEIEDTKRKAAEAVVEAERVAAEKAEADRLADLERREKETAAKEAELKAAQDAIDAKQREVEQAEREKRIAESAAQTAREEAEEKVKAEAEHKEREEEDRLDAIEIEKDMAAAKEANRIADKEHQAKCQSEALAVIGRIVGPGGVELSIKLLAAIIDGDIPNVTINY